MFVKQGLGSRFLSDLLWRLTAMAWSVRELSFKLRVGQGTTKEIE